MFRDGQYLEVIKVADNCLVTAVVTVQEKIIKLKEKRISTNKWLDLEDWAALYKILEKAILRNVRTERSVQDTKKSKWKKSTRQLDVTYTFEPSENAKDVTSCPIIRVNVCPAKKELGEPEVLKTVSKKEEIHLDRSVDKAIEKIKYESTCEKDESNISTKKHRNHESITGESNNVKDYKSKRYLPTTSLDNEEYVPDAPMPKKLCANLNYIPSKKSTLEQIQVSSNEYTPAVSGSKSVTKVIRYIPNSTDLSKISHEAYEPTCATDINQSEEYVPNSKGIKASVEEYHPDFTRKSMKFDDSYVPSCVQVNADEWPKKLLERHKKLQSEKHMTRRKETSMKRSLFT